MQKEVPLVFESSWEVCNKVGGIFTVVSSKAATMKAHYGENYFLVGPFFPKKTHGIFEERVAPDELKPVFDQLEEEGIHCVYGTWLVKGNPQVILIDFSRFASHQNDIKKNMWEWYGVDSLNTSYFDFDEAVIWSYAVGRLVHTCQVLASRIVYHGHEWLAAAGLLYACQEAPGVATVFTTHATTLGRSLANGDKPLYEMLDHMNPDEEAKRIGSGVAAKHQLEKQTAHNVHCFTTVSEITGLEAEKILGVAPQVLVYNGLDMEKFPTFEETTLKHRLYKEKAFEFLMYYFFPYYAFDLHHTRLLFLAGRNELHDKGIDVYIDALADMNQKMKKERTQKTVVAFLFVPGDSRDVEPQLLENKTHYTDIRETVNDNIEDIKHQIIKNVLSNKPLSITTLFDENTQFDIKKKMLRLKKENLTPPLATHRLADADTNAILARLKEKQLNNTKDDPVKVVYYPVYLSGADGLLDLSYYEAMMACHLGVFPSYYEPWGYTPQEAAALGVPSVTTDLAGFGRYIQSQQEQPKHTGIWVIPRQGKPYDDVVEELAQVMHEYVTLDQKDRVNAKIAAKARVQDASWSLFGKRYLKAHQHALDTLSS